MPRDDFPSVRALRENAVITDVEIGIEKEDHEVVWTSVSATPLPFGIGTATVTVDITARKMAEEQIQNLLKEKELLLQEVHHRIKNNMSIIMSLLALQQDNATVSEAARALGDARDRMRSMLTLYEKLYRSANVKELNIQSYLATLIDEIVDNSATRIPVTVEKRIDDFIVEARIVSVLGIIINELITNIMKHAFVGRDRGMIIVSAMKQDHRAIFAVEDDGIGLPESVTIGASGGFGLQLVDLLTRQMAGSIRIERGRGTKVIVECGT